ncbi:ATP-binding protein [Streptomyces kebangsaanensis]|uniref:ATP-binding protein n=1 Tax=Streptomyces kebangsaanensis TaxID=864058 RepID=A0ABW6KXN5_9ACTN
MTPHQITDEAKPEPPHTPAAHQLTLRFSSTRRGARLARRLAVRQLTEWTGLPHDAEPARTVALVTAEPASNAIRHGSVPGRDFRLTLLLLPHGLRIEVTDIRPERLPPHPAAPSPPVDASSGRGVLLVQVYADCWGCTVLDEYTKTAWAEVSLPAADASPSDSHGRTPDGGRRPADGRGTEGGGGRSPEP